MVRLCAVGGKAFSPNRARSQCIGSSMCLCCIQLGRKMKPYSSKLDRCRLFPHRRPCIEGRYSVFALVGQTCCSAAQSGQGRLICVVCCVPHVCISLLQVFRFLQAEGLVTLASCKLHVSQRSQARGIGTCHALFYEAAAANLERQHRFQQSESAQHGFQWLWQLCCSGT